jgi:hypothetical protein
MERISTPPVINNHDTVVEIVDPSFSDEENDAAAASPTKIIKIDDEEDDVPLGAYFFRTYLSPFRSS